MHKHTQKMKFSIKDFFSNYCAVSKNRCDKQNISGTCPLTRKSPPRTALQKMCSVLVFKIIEKYT